MIEVAEILKNIEPYQADLFEKNEFLRLNSNENQFGASKKVLKALKKITQKELLTYPAYGNLMEILAKKFNLNLENFLITAGCDEAICTVYRTYLNPNDKVLSYSPTFSVPKIISETQGAEFVEIDYDEKWSFNLEKIIKKAQEINPKIIHITSPNSPTGEIVSSKDIKTILETFKDTIVVLDNTYSNYASETYKEAEILNYENLFITKSFSKDYAIAGLRLGYVISQKNNIKNLSKAILPYSVNKLALIAGAEALLDQKHFEKVKKNTEKNKAELTKFLNKFGFKTYHSEGNFVLCDMGDKAEFIYKKLLQNKILIKKFGDNALKNTFRITVPNNVGLKKFKKALKVKPLLVFDIDGVLFDVQNSYREAILETYKEFKGEEISKNAIQEAKNKGGLNCDWALTQYLLKENGVDVSLDDVIEKFQKHFFSKKADGSMGLIDREEIIIKKDLIKNLNKKYDLCVFTGRPEDEAKYSLQKYGILDYFNIIITKNSLTENEQKPHPAGLNLIKKSAIYKNILYFGDTKDDMICAKSADVNCVGILPPQDKSKKLANELIENGAKIVLNNINEIRKVLWEVLSKQEKQAKLQFKLK